MSDAAPNDTTTTTPGVSAPLLLVASNNKSGFIAIITALAMCFVLMAFGIRIYVRMAISGFRLDDLVLTIASSSVVFLQVGKGFGKSSELLGPSQIMSIEKSVYASDILYIFTLYLSKLCVGFLYLRLTPDRSHSKAAWATMVASTVWAIISIFLIALRCNPSHPWTDIDSQCSGYFARWQFVGALDIITELALFSMSVYLVYGLQMSMKSKAIVVGAFAFRLPVIVAAALHLHYLHLQILSANPFLAGAYTAACAQFELGYGIMASSMPCLKPFMSAYEGPFRPPNNKGSGQNNSSGDYKFTTYGSRSQGHNNNNHSNHSKRLRSGKPAHLSSGSTDGDISRRLCQDQAIYKATISHPDKSNPITTTSAHHHHHHHNNNNNSSSGRKHGSVDSGDSRQMIIQKEDMVIKKEVKWSVEREGGDDDPADSTEERRSEPSDAITMTGRGPLQPEHPS